MAKSNFIVRGGADFSGVTKGLSGLQKQFNGFQSKISKSMSLVTKVLGGLAISKLIKDSTSAAMGVENSIGQISRIMGANASTFNSWAETQAKSFGMAREEAYKYGAVYGNLISGFAKDTAETTRYTEQLIKTSAVVASATGRTMEDTMERIRSGLLGNTEAIEDLGIYAQVGAITATEAFKTLAKGKSWQQLDYNTQQQIRLMSILEQANRKYGDSLAGTTATRQMMFLATLKNIRLNLGQAFLPIYNVVLPLLTSLGNMLESVTSRLAAFSQALFGKSATQATKNIENQAKAVSELGESTDAAGKAAKGALAGFDELNVLQQNEADGGAAAVAGVAGSDAGGVEVIGEDAAAKTEEIAGKIKSYLTPLSEAFERLKAAAEPLKETVFAGLRWVYENVFMPLGSWIGGEALPAFLEVLAGALEILNAVLIAIKPFVVWLWDKFLQPIAEWTGGTIISILEGVGTALTKIGDWIKDHQTLVENIAIAATGFATAWGLVNLAVGIWTGIGALATGVTTAFGAAVAFLTSPITLTVLAIGAVIIVVLLLIRHWDDVKKAAGIAWEWIKSKWSIVATWFDTHVVSPIAAFFGGLWEGIKSAGGLLADWIKEHVIDPVVGLFKGMYNAVVGVMESMINGFIWLINNFIKGVNKMVDAINRIPGVSVPTIGTLQTVGIPRLAAGAVIPPNKEFLALLGDQTSGTNIEAPLETIIKAFNTALDTRGDDINIRNVIELDGRVVYENQRKVARQRGKNLVKGWAY